MVDIPTDQLRRCAIPTDQLRRCADRGFRLRRDPHRRPGKIVGRTRHTPMMATVLAIVIVGQYVLLASIVYNAVRGFASSAKDFANN